MKIKKKVMMNKEINEKEETKVTKQEEYNQILELFGEKAEENRYK